MTTSISNATQKILMCCENYQKKEISDVTKVVELACHHFHHISCLSKSRCQKDKQPNLDCCYDNREFAPPAQEANPFANQEIFQARLEEIRGAYNYDKEVMEAIVVVADLYTSLHDLSNSLLKSLDGVANQMEGEEQKPSFTQAIGDLVIKNEMIKEDLKTTVLRVLSIMITGDRL